MSVRDHRDNAEGKRYKGRMPNKSDINLGIRVHKDKCQEEEEPIVDRCMHCDDWSEVDKDGICDKCWESINE